MIFIICWIRIQGLACLSLPPCWRSCRIISSRDLCESWGILLLISFLSHPTPSFSTLCIFPKAGDFLFFWGLLRENNNNSGLYYSAHRLDFFPFAFFPPSPGPTPSHPCQAWILTVVYPFKEFRILIIIQRHQHNWNCRSRHLLENSGGCAIVNLGLRSLFLPRVTSYSFLFSAHPTTLHVFC